MRFLLTYSLLALIGLFYMGCGGTSPSTVTYPTALSLSGTASLTPGTMPTNCYPYTATATLDGDAWTATADTTFKFYVYDDATTNLSSTFGLTTFSDSDCATTALGNPASIEVPEGESSIVLYIKETVGSGPTFDPNDGSYDMVVKTNEDTVESTAFSINVSAG